MLIDFGLLSTTHAEKVREIIDETGVEAFVVDVVGAMAQDLLRTGCLLVEARERPCRRHCRADRT